MSLRPGSLAPWPLLGLASPFLDLANPMHGIIGLIILLVGLRIAWQLTAAKPLEISGPLESAPAVVRLKRRDDEHRPHGV